MTDPDARLEREELAAELADSMLSGRTNSADIYRWHKRATALARKLRRRRESLIVDLKDDAEAMLWAVGRNMT